MYPKAAIILASLLTLSSATPLGFLRLPSPLDVPDVNEGSAPAENGADKAQCRLTHTPPFTHEFEVYVPIDMVNRDEECGKTYKDEYNGVCPGVSGFYCDMLDENLEVLSNDPKEEAAVGMIMKFTVSSFCTEANIGMAVGKASAAEDKGVKCVKENEKFSRG